MITYHRETRCFSRVAHLLILSIRRFALKSFSFAQPLSCANVTDLCFSIRSLLSVHVLLTAHSVMIDVSSGSRKRVQRHLYVSTPHRGKCLVVLCVLTEFPFWSWSPVACASLPGGWSLVVQIYVGYSGHSCMAQWLEQLTADQQVPGSILAGSHGLRSWRGQAIRSVRWSTLWAQSQCQSERLHEIQIRW